MGRDCSETSVRSEERIQEDDGRRVGDRALARRSADRARRLRTALEEAAECAAPMHSPALRKRKRRDRRWMIDEIAEIVLDIGPFGPANGVVFLRLGAGIGRRDPHQGGPGRGIPAPRR